MNIHLEVCHEICDCVEYAFEAANLGYSFHDISHPLLLDFDDKVIHPEKLVRLLYCRNLAQFSENFVFLVGNHFDEDICFVNLNPLL